MTTSFSMQDLAGQQSANMDTLLTMANSAFDAAENLTNLHISSMRTLCEDGVANARALCAATTPSEALSLAAPQATAERVTAYWRQFFDVCNQFRQDVSGQFQSRADEANQAAMNMLDQAARSGPSGSEFIASAFRSFVASSNAAFDSLNRAAQQMGQMAEGGMEAAGRATAKAMANASPVSQQTRRAA